MTPEELESAIAWIYQHWGELSKEQVRRFGPEKIAAIVSHQYPGGLEAFRREQVEAQR